MRKVSIKNPYPNGFEDENDPVALAYIETLKEVRQALADGKLYGMFVDGDRKGSICKLHQPVRLDAYGRERDDEPRIGYRTRWNSSDKKVRCIENDGLYGLICTWDGRRNKVKASWWEILPILDYDGPTIWEKFDAKAAKEELLKNPDQTDIDGNILAEGDRVFYINARYGSGFGLERGTVKEFKASVDSKGHVISTVIENDQGQLSSLKYPHEMVCKIGKENDA